MAEFKEVLHRLRKRYLGKQFTLAAALGCTEASVSYWEHGRRLPQRDLLPRLIECFRNNGAQEAEVSELQEAYGGSGANPLMQLTGSSIVAAATIQGEIER